MSEYRLPEEDTIGGRREEEPADERGPEPESGEKPKPRTEREEERASS